DEPAARDDVDVGGHLGEDGGMTIGVPGHDGADAHARGQSREGGEGRPGFQHVADPVGSVRHEVIGDAGSVPATRLIRVAPEIEDVVPRGAAHAGEDREAHACSFEVAGRCSGYGRVSFLIFRPCSSRNSWSRFRRSGRWPRRMATASSAALMAPGSPTATVPTRIAPRIWTAPCTDSLPSRDVLPM